MHERQSSKQGRCILALVVLLLLPALPLAAADHINTMTGSQQGSNGLQVTLRWEITATGGCCGGAISWDTGDGATGSIDDGYCSGSWCGDASGSGQLTDGRPFAWQRQHPIGSGQIDVTYGYNEPGTYTVPWNDCCGSSGQYFSGEIQVTTAPTPPGSTIPRHLEATNVPGVHAIQLTWTTPETAQAAASPIRHNIYRSVNDGAFEFLDWTGTGDNQYTDQDMHSVGSYRYYVTALVGQESSPTNVAGASIRAPGAPTDLRATTTAAGRNAQLTWNTPADQGTAAVTHYLIDKATNGGPFLFYASTFTAPFTDANIQPATSYAWRVVADNGFLSGPSNAAGILIDAPNRVQGLNAQPHSLDQGFLATWLPPDDAGTWPLTGYNVYVSRPGQASTLRATRGPADPQYIDTQVDQPGTYAYIITATNPLEGAGSSVTVQAVAPSAPLALVAQANVPARQIELTWAPPSNPGTWHTYGYNIYRGTSPDNLQLHAQRGMSETLYEDWNIEQGVTYHYAVRAVNRWASAPSPLASAVIPAPPPPALVRADPETATLGVAVTWTPSADEASFWVAGITYRTYRSLSGATPTLVQDGTLSYAYLDGEIPAPGRYSYTVTAASPVEGPPSAPAILDVRAPGAPRGLEVVVRPDRESVQLVWDRPADEGTWPVVNYDVLRGTSPDNLARLVTTLAPSFEDTGIEPGVTYYYAVAARNRFLGPASAPVDTVWTVTRTATGILEFDGAATIPQFPCSQPRCYGGSFAGNVSGGLTGTYGDNAYELEWSTLLAPGSGGGVQAVFDYGEFACLAGQQSVLGDAAGSGTISIRPGQITGRWYVPGEQPAIPRSITEARVSFTFEWVRAGTGAVIQLNTLSVDVDVAGLGTRRIIDSPAVPNIGAADFVPHAGGTVPACSSPQSIQGEIGGSVPLHA